MLEGLKELQKAITLWYGLLQVKGYKLKEQRERVHRADQHGKITIFYHLSPKEHQVRQSHLFETDFVEFQLPREKF